MILRPVYRRAIRGLLGRPVCRVDEIPESSRPSRLATFSRGATSETLSSSLVVVSYNVQRGEKMNAVGRSLRTVIDRYRPQVVLLQEAPRELLVHPAIRDDFAARSVLFAPFHLVEEPDSRYRFSRYGQVVATTCNVVRWRVVELPTINPAGLGRGHTLKRIAVSVETLLNEGRSLGITNIHFEPFAWPRSRLAQYNEVLRRLREWSTDIELLCGDFNTTLLQRTEHGLALLDRLGYENAFRHRWRTLDTCLARGHERVVQASRLRLRGSDHRPILVRLVL